jgi:hypothetical protein
MRTITTPYTALETWLYDRFVGPVLSPLHQEIERELFSRMSA